MDTLGTLNWIHKFHLFVHGTSEKTFIVEFKEWKWINSKTHLTFVSNKNMKSTIKTSLQKTFDFFQHLHYTWTENQMNSMLNQALDLLSTEIENEDDEKIRESKTLDSGQEIPSTDLGWDYDTFRNMSGDGAKTVLTSSLLHSTHPYVSELP